MTTTRKGDEDETMLRARNIPPSDNSAYELTQAIEKAEAKRRKLSYPPNWKELAKACDDAPMHAKHAQETIKRKNREALLAAGQLSFVEEAQG